MMTNCWETIPEDRPTFKELSKSTSKYLEHIAGYLEMGFNPFVGSKSVKKRGRAMSLK